MVSWNVRMPNTTKPESFASLESLTNVFYRVRPLIGNPNPDPKYVNLGDSHMNFAFLSQLRCRLFYMPAFYPPCFYNLLCEAHM